MYARVAQGGRERAGTNRYVGCPRAFRPSDIAEAVAIFANCFHRRIGPDAARRLAATFEHYVRSDPAGCWVAERNGIVLGFVLSCLRGDQWAATALYVDPQAQSSGTGRELLDRAWDYGERAASRLVLSSGDPRATQLYLGYGCTLVPSMRLTGRASGDCLNSHQVSRRADSADIEQMSAIERAVRGGSAICDTEFLLRTGASARILETPDAHAYALFRVGDPPIDGVPLKLVGTTAEVTETLLVDVLQQAPGPVAIDWLTAADGWAFRVAAKLGLRLLPSGPVFSVGNHANSGTALASGFFP